MAFSKRPGFTREATGTLTNQAMIPAGESVTQQAIYHVQAGHQALLRRLVCNVLKISGGGSPRVTLKLWVWNPGVTNARYLIRRIKIDTGVSNDIRRDFDPPLSLSPTDVVWVQATTDTNNTVVDAEFDLVEYRLPAT